jgi:hypothetical protein
MPMFQLLQPKPRNGPVLSVTTPTDALSGLVAYSNEVDNPSIMTANLPAHAISANNAMQSRPWTFTNNINNSGSAAAAAFDSM